MNTKKTAIQKSDSQGLKKSLSPINVWSLAFGCIIGWGAFMMPGTTFLPTAGTIGSTIAIAIGAVIMIIIAFSYSYMIPKYPLAGGEYCFTQAIFGKRHAFVCAWFLVLAYISNVPLNATALGLMTRKLFFGVFQIGRIYSVAGYDIYLGEIGLAAAALVFCALLSIFGMKKTGQVQTVMAVSLTVSFLIIVISALFSPITSWENLKPLWNPDPSADKSQIISGILAIVAVAPWAYVGFDTIPQTAEEFDFSPKKVNVIMIIAILFGMCVYACNNLVTAAASPDWTAFIQEHDWAVGAAVEALMGKTGLVVLGVSITSAILTGMLGFMTAASRLLYSLAKEGYIPSFFGNLHFKHKTPWVSLVFCLFFSLVGPWFGRTALGWFVDMASTGGAIAYGYTCASAFVQLKREGDLRRRMLLAILTVLGTIFSLFFLVLLLVPGMPGSLTTAPYIMLCIWIVCGIVFYCVKGKKALEQTS